MKAIASSQFAKSVTELKRLKRINGLAESISRREERLINKGVPLQRILGFINYDDLVIKVSRHVFIPRLETVEVVNAAVALIKPGASVLDLCAGSGFIGLSIRQKVAVNVTLADLSRAAIRQIKQNARLNKLTVQVIRSNLFQKIEGKFDLIVANPPYLPLSMKLEPQVIKHDPTLALWGGISGNDYYERIIESAPLFIKPGGNLVFEIGPDNAKYLADHGFSILPDINGLPRIAIKHFALV